MDEQSGNRGLWIALIVALLAALAFLVLWYLRGGEVDRVNTALRTAQAQATSTSQRLERDLRQAQSDADTASRRVTELENQVRDEQRRAAETTQQVERRLRGELDISAARVRELTAELERERADVASRSNEELESIRGQADEARRELQTATEQAAALRTQLEEARQGMADATAAGESATERIASLESGMAELRTRLEQSEEALRQARRLNENHPEVARLTGELGTSAAALADLRQRYADLESRLAAPADEADEEEGGSVSDEQAPNAAEVLDEARRTIAELESRIAAVETDRNRMSAALEQARDQLRERQADAPKLAEAEKRIADLEAERDGLAERVRAEAEPAAASTADLERRATEAEAARDAAARELESARDTIARLEGTIGDLRASNNNLGRELETAHQDLAKAEADARQLREEYDVLQLSHDELSDAEQTLQLHLEEVTRTGDAEDQGTVASAPAAGAVENGQPTVVINPGRSVGRVIDKLADGRTYIIDKGRRQGIRPGMRFDVHRPHDSINRFTGIIQVTQPMEDISVAMIIPAADAAICPVTGRAYLEPGAKYSPYAMSADGRPVPLISPASVGLDKETPATGDLIDNPFYDPARRISFMLCPEVAGDRQAVRAIEALGCVVTADKPVTEIDYLLVERNGAFAGDVGGPRRVTREHVGRYISVPLPAGQ